jgi:hypothetical protein
MHAIRAATIAAAATALTFACASMAQAAVVSDPDEPGIAQDLDIASATSNWLGVPGSPMITQTISTYAAYSRRPCLRISAAGVGYRACGATLYSPTSKARITMTETGNTVTYRFAASQIGSPVSYRWLAYLGTDRTRTAKVVLPGGPTVDDDDPFPELPEPIDPPDFP